MKNTTSSYATATKIYQPSTPKNIIKRVLFVLESRKHSAAIDRFHSRLAKLNIQANTEMLGTIIWPYIHNEWDVSTKLDTIASHYEILTPEYSSLTQLNTSGERLEICDFSETSPTVTIGIDYAQWFTREGELTVNVFQADLRVASMAFTLAEQDGEIVAFIGAVQGIHGGVSAEESLDIYKVLTKQFHGLRPRSMLLEVLKVIVKKLGAQKIYGVTEENRHHRHKYFGNDQHTTFKNDYNAFWDEHAGVKNNETGFYAIDMQPAIRDISEIAAKKRGQYRRRNEFVEAINTAVNLTRLATN